MSVAALPVRPTARPQPPTVTVTIDIALGAEGLSPPARHLLALVRDLVDTSGGQVRMTPALVPAPRAPLPDPDTVVVRAGSREVALDGTPVRLTRLEYDLLLFLARHPRQVFTRNQLLRHVWGYEHAVERTVDVHVRRLRGKIGAHVPVVTTVYGVGYRLADEARLTILPED